MRSNIIFLTFFVVFLSGSVLATVDNAKDKLQTDEGTPKISNITIISSTPSTSSTNTTKHAINVTTVGVGEKSSVAPIISTTKSTLLVAPARPLPPSTDDTGSLITGFYIFLGIGLLAIGYIGLKTYRFVVFFNKILFK